MDIDRPNFDIAEIKARDLRLFQSYNDLNLDVRTMEFDMPIVIDTYQNYASITGINVKQLEPDKSLEDGYTIICDDLYLVLYNADFSSYEHLNWTLAHEIGHIYLGHDTDGTSQEVEAHWFAAELLAPESIIRNMAKKIPIMWDNIHDLFGLSFTAANKRIDTLNKKFIRQSYREDELLYKYSEAMECYMNNFGAVYTITG